MSAEPTPQRVLVGKLDIDFVTNKATVADQPIGFQPREMQMLKYLAEHKNRFVTREMIYNHLYPPNGETGDKVIDVLICKIRKKIGALNEGVHYIESVYRKGYCLKDPEATPR